MDIKHIIEKIKLEEGVNDPSIFKAVFLAGGPGSGKSFIVGKTALSSLGMRIVNSDPAFEKALQKAGLKMEPDDIWSDAGQAARVVSKKVTSKQQSLYVQGRLGLVIDGTGKDYDKISKQKKQLEKLGYETAMIFVNTNLETAVARDAARSRTLGTTEVGKMWKGVQDNIGKFQRAFKAKMFIVDNSDGADFERDVMATYRSISAWAKKTPTNKAAKKWIDGQKAKRNITEILDEAKFSSKDIKMAIGIASDPRYKGGNMTGAVKAIDKIKRGLSDHPQVSAVLKRQNEDINEMRDFVSETAEMMMRDMVIMSKKIDELMEAMEAEMARPQMDEFDIEPWIVSKVTKAKDYIDSVYDYAVLDNDEDID